MKNLVENYDIVVVGAGHAGCEAALAGARLGLNTIMFTVSVDRSRSSTSFISTLYFKIFRPSIFLSDIQIFSIDILQCLFYHILRCS